jgi:hypothetical protein
LKHHKPVIFLTVFVLPFILLLAGCQSGVFNPGNSLNPAIAAEAVSAGGILNVRDYAAGDGKTDDTSALQALLDEAFGWIRKSCSISKAVCT